MQKQKSTLRGFILLVLLSLISFSCKDNDAPPDSLPDDDDNLVVELLPLPKGVISTGSKGNPISQNIIDNIFVDGFMILQSWNSIETSEGIFNWNHIDSEVTRATAANKIVRVAIHAGGESVPDWVMQNYPEIKEIFVVDKKTVERRYHPAYWDQTFIEIKSKFYKAVAERYKDENTVFAISVSMADPNTGDWSFRIDDDEQKQAYIDAGFTETVFIEAYKQLIDSAMASFGNKYVVTAVGPISSKLVSDDSFALNEVLNYAFDTYGDQLILAKGALHANTPDPTLSNDLKLWQEIWDFRPHCAAQFVWQVTNDPEFKMNGKTPYLESEKIAIFRKATDIALKYELNWIEPWSADVLNSALQDELAYAQSELKK